MLIKYTTVREVKDPVRGHYTDAGIDLYVPEMNEKFRNDFKSLKQNEKADMYEHGVIKLAPKTSCLIPSGVKFEIPYSTMGLMLNKSGVASKKGLLVGAQVIDTFYSGEVHINLHNVSYDYVSIIGGEKIIQMVLVPILIPELTYVDDDELYSSMHGDSYRQEGGFGSTNK